MDQCHHQGEPDTGQGNNLSSRLLSLPQYTNKPKGASSQEVGLHVVIHSSQWSCPIYAVQAMLLPLTRLCSTPILCTYTLSAGISKAHLPKFGIKYLNMERHRYIAALVYEIVGFPSEGLKRRTLGGSRTKERGGIYNICGRSSP